MPWMVRIMQYGLNLMRLIALLVLVLVAQNANGFGTLAPTIATTRNNKRLWNPVNHQEGRQRSLMLHVRGNRRRRLHANDDTTAPTAEDYNPRLRGIRQCNVGLEGRTWMESYEKLLEYKRSHQNCRVPQRYSLDRPLGLWVMQQRENGRESLSLERLELLDKAGFYWETKDQRNNRVWLEMYQRLIDYKERYGDCCVPQNYKHDKALGQWVKVHRQHRKQGRLPDDRKEQLDAIGFIWALKRPPEELNTDHVDRIWDERFEALQAFRKKWGHCVVPGRFEEDPSLGRWVETQRGVFQRGLMRPDRKKRLEEVEFVFGINSSNSTDQGLGDRHWNSMFQHLVNFKETNGHTEVTLRRSDFLGLWVRAQRANKSSMDKHRKQQLDAIGFQWSKSQVWQGRLEELCKYKKIHGTWRVKSKDNSALANWVHYQRRQIRQGTLSSEKAGKLESIGFH